MDLQSVESAATPASRYHSAISRGLDTLNNFYNKHVISNDSEDEDESDLSW